MTTAERAHALAEACAAFPWLAPVTAGELLNVVATELSDESALDRWVPHGAHHTRAIPRSPILHILAGNTPAAAIQTLTRGLLLGAHNLLKLPSADLPEVAIFLERLPAALRDRVTCRTDLPDTWLTQAEAVIIFGQDSTVADVHRRLRPDQVFIPHGHKVSFGIVHGPITSELIESAVADVIAFDQLGCLSPHVFYVIDNARAFAERLASAMAAAESRSPRPPAPVSVANQIRTLREEVAFRTANGEPCTCWQSPGSTAWTVIYDESPGFPRTPLHRTIFIKPLPTDLTAEIASVQPYLSCIGLHSATPDFAEVVAALGASRICPIGRMQQPQWSWHQDGMLTLAPLVRWVDWEG